MRTAMGKVSMLESERWRMVWCDVSLLESLRRTAMGEVSMPESQTRRTVPGEMIRGGYTGEALEKSLRLLTR